MDTREAYIEHLEARLRQRAEHIEALKARAEKHDRSAMFAMHKRIEDLEARQRALHVQLASIRTEAAWEDLKRGAEQSWQDLTDTLDDALAALGDTGERKEQSDDRSQGG